MVRHAVTASILFGVLATCGLSQSALSNTLNSASSLQRTVAAPTPIIVREVGLTGDNNNVVTCIKRRPDGKYVVGGWTSSASIAATVDGLPVGASSARTGAGEDGFVAIMSADLATVEYMTFLSGAKDERVRGLDFLDNGNVCVVGGTNSPDFLLTGTTFGQQHGAGTDAFITIFSPDLKTQKVGMLIPGNGTDVATGVVVNKQGHIVVVGNTTSTSGFSALKVLDDTANGGVDGFIYILNSSLLYADFFSYVGGVADDYVVSVALDKSNAAVICGTTKSQDFYTFPKKIRIPTGGGGGGKGDIDPSGGSEGGYEEVGKDPYSKVFGGGESDIFVSKFASDGEPVYSTYFGGNGADVATGLFIDANEGAFVVGSTSSSNLPTESSTTTFGGKTDGFVAAITSDGLRLSGASYIGGTDDDEITAVAQLDGTTALVVGRTSSTDFPVIGIGATSGTHPCAFIARMTIAAVGYASGMTLEGDEHPLCVAIDQFQDAVFAGSTFGTQKQGGAPTTAAFISKWAFGVLTYKSPAPSDALCSGKPATIQWNTEGFTGQPLLTVDLSVDGGGNWIPLAADVKSKQLAAIIPASIPVGTHCIVRVRTDRGHMVTSAELTVQSTPAVTEQPKNTIACPNTTVTLSTGSTDPGAKVQWRMNGQNIPGATNPDLVLENVSSTSAGGYDAIITNSCGSVTSDEALVDVSDKPLIDEQPKDASVEPGTQVVFTTVARGTDLNYQWRKNASDISGATTNTFTIEHAAAADAGVYTCVISSACGNASTTDATLAIKGTSGVAVGTWPDGSSIDIRPQPATDQLMVSIPALDVPLTLVVRSLQGSELQRLTLVPGLSGQSTAINVSNLPTGAYILQCSSTALQTAVRFTVVR